jgi:prophage regulatory protein
MYGDDTLIILEPECARLTRLSRATRARAEKAGRFPRRIQLSPRRVGWRRADILNWIEERVRAANTEARVVA